MLGNILSSRDYSVQLDLLECMTRILRVKKSMWKDVLSTMFQQRHFQALCSDASLVGEIERKFAALELANAGSSFPARAREFLNIINTERVLGTARKLCEHAHTHTQHAQRETFSHSMPASNSIHSYLVMKIEFGGHKSFSEEWVHVGPEGITLYLHTVRLTRVFIILR